MEKAEKKLPTATEIDTLAALYDDAKSNVAIAEERMSLFGSQLLTMVKEYGVTPPRAEKSLRLEGDEWEVTVSEGQGVTVKKAAVEKIFRALKKVNVRLHRTLFPKLFTKETTYKLAKGAQELMAATLPAGAPPNLRKLFAEAVQIRDKAPRLTVEPKNEAKK